MTESSCSSCPAPAAQPTLLKHLPSKTNLAQILETRIDTKLVQQNRPYSNTCLVKPTLLKHLPSKTRIGTKLVQQDQQSSKLSSSLSTITHPSGRPLLFTEIEALSDFTCASLNLPLKSPKITKLGGFMVGSLRNDSTFGVLKAFLLKKMKKAECLDFWRALGHSSWQ